ncbi:MAG: tRNA (adenosine(37)-N6)-threonylcarbamoyltransferase complex ATPase subunit type 1 TsaE [bacterium]|nr:tRNA (adenosine(37)-N6)-threonylcarbamoyltransferase complex ATPase subunit type 1 TsaE [bacterium]
MPRASTTIATASARETHALGKSLAKRLHGGEVFAINGELGAGKTVLVRGLAEGLGVRHRISSPTFLLMRVYRIKKRGSEIRHFVHVDAYRVKHPAELTDIGLKELLGRSDTVVAIEWARQVAPLLPKRRYDLTLRLGKTPSTRHLTLRRR